MLEGIELIAGVVGGGSSIRLPRLRLVETHADTWSVADDRDERSSAERVAQTLEEELATLPGGSGLAYAYRAWLKTLETWRRLRP